MKVFVIRDRESGEIMPQAKKDGGYSHWLTKEDFQCAEDYPRLFTCDKKAKRCITQWARGTYEWMDFIRPDGWLDQKKVWNNHGRQSTDLEVVEYKLEEVK